MCCSSRVWHSEAADWLQPASNQRRVFRGPAEKTTAIQMGPSVCAKTRRIKETAETADVSPARLFLQTRTQRFKCPRFLLHPSVVHGPWTPARSSSRFSHVHCDFSEQVMLVYLHHLVGQRVDPVFVHRLSGVGDSVEPATQGTGEAFFFSRWDLVGAGVKTKNSCRILWGSSVVHCTTSNIRHPAEKTRNHSL